MLFIAPFAWQQQSQEFITRSKGRREERRGEEETGTVGGVERENVVEGLEGEEQRKVFSL